MLKENYVRHLNPKNAENNFFGRENFIHVNF